MKNFRLFYPLFIFLTILVLLGRISGSGIIPTGSLGAYLHNNLDLTHSPLAYQSSLTNGKYNFEIGWIEPIADSTHRGLFQNTFMNPLFQIDIFPYSSDYSVLFNMKCLKWIEMGLGYKRLLFHKSMIGWKSKPTRSSWRPFNILEKIPDQGELAGADIFVYRLYGELQLPLSVLSLNSSIEQWDIDTEGLTHVFLYSKDILVEAQEIIYEAKARLTLIPSASIQPAIQTEIMYAHRVDLLKNKVSAGITGIPLNRDQHISLTLLVDYWTVHPHISSSEVLKSFQVSAHFDWNIVLISQ